MIDLKRFRKDKKIKQSEICEILGISQPFLSAIEKGSRPLNDEKFNKLYSHYGNIILEYKQTERPIVVEAVLPEDRSNAKPKMISELEVTIAPLISQYAQAGYLCGFADKEYLDKQPMYVATQKYSGGNYVAFEIRGDSMDNDRRNAICNGDVVLGRELNKDYWKCKLHIPRVFVIVHREEGILLKEIIEHDVENGIITCHSYNPNKILYPDFQLHLKDVQQLFYMKELRRGND